MPDTAEIARNAHDNGFDKGTIAACNAILSYLQRTGHNAAAASVLQAWNDGSLVQQQAQPEPKPTTDPASFEPGPVRRKMSFVQAKGSGYTGNECQYCHGMRMTISGHCEKCEDCGESSGCS